MSAGGGGGLGVDEGSGWYLWLSLVLGISLIGLAAILMTRKRHIPVLQAIGGGDVAIIASISRRSVVAAVRQSEMVPSQDLFKSIVHKLEEGE
jgi:hypothetical protein